MDRGTISTLKRTTPVPAPRALPGGVHRTIRPGFATLQEQMRLEHDRETFLKIVVSRPPYCQSVVMDATHALDI